MSTRITAETHGSLRRLQLAMRQSLPVMLRTIIRDYEATFLRRCTEEERAAFRDGTLDRNPLIKARRGNGPNVVRKLEETRQMKP